VPPDDARTARQDALAELAAEAARFAATGPPTPPKVGAARKPDRSLQGTMGRSTGGASSRARSTTLRPARIGGVIAGYVPNAVAPERGNTRPLVPVDGRLHLRAAPAMIEALDGAVAELRLTDPKGLRDLERATLVRIGAAVILADIAANGAEGLVGEAIRAALDPAQRHLDVAMPDPSRWLRAEPIAVSAARDGDEAV
jgi:hypothetical protein